jgi:PAS domain S-box-containing protein
LDKLAAAVTGFPEQRPGNRDFQMLADNAPVMIWRSGADRLRIWFNQQWLDFRGRTLEEELGHGWAEGVHPDDLQGCLATQSSASDRRETFSIEYRLCRHDGIFRWVLENGRAFHASDGEFLGFFGTCVDITEQKQAAHNLAAALADREVSQTDIERRFQLLVNGVSDYAIYLLDPEGRVTNWNTGAERIKGYGADEIIGQHYSVFFTEEDRQYGVPMAALQKALTDGRHEDEGWRLRKDGSRFRASTLVNPIYADDGTLQGFAKITRDITEKREAQALLERAREQLFQSQKLEAVGQLTGGIAHDFNNLLTVALGNLDIAQRHLCKGAIDMATLRRLINNAVEGAQRATTLTERLLAYARRQPLDPKPLDPNRVISSAGEFLQRSLGETIDVCAIGGGGVWAIEVDPHQLDTALLNLALNARDAMPDGGKLTLETSNAYLDEEYTRINPEVIPGEYVLLSVTDNGTGMDEATAARAFEPFFTTKGAGSGTGLGLSQVYGFVKQSGGHIKIYSELGQGTTFRIYLPRRIGDGPIQTPTLIDSPRTADNREVILLVEDDTAVRTYLLEVMRELGYRVLEAPDARSGLSAIELTQNRIDLLLTDVVLPDFNGRELARRAHELRPDLKVLFMTGYSRNAIVHQGRLDPGVAMIQKPILQTTLAKRIRDTLDRRP